MTEFRAGNINGVAQATFSVQIPFTDKSIRFSSQIFPSRNATCVAMGSECEDGRHVIFLDYDELNLHRALRDLEFLQEKYKLSHAFIFQLHKGGSYHAVILDRLSSYEVFKIQCDSNTDLLHRESYIQDTIRMWSLRITEKGNRGRPIWRGTLMSKHTRNEISTAHYNFLRKYYHIQPAKFKKQDKFKHILFHRYLVGRRIDENFFHRIEKTPPEGNRIFSYRKDSPFPKSFVHNPEFLKGAFA